MKLTHSQSQALTYVTLILLSVIGVLIQRFAGGFIPVPTWLKDYEVLIGTAGALLVSYLQKGLLTGDWGVSPPNLSEVKSAAAPSAQPHVYHDPPAPAPDLPVTTTLLPSPEVPAMELPRTQAPPTRSTTQMIRFGGQRIEDS